MRAVLLVAVGCMTGVSAPVQAQEIDWSGPYTELQWATATGTHSFGYAHDELNVHHRLYSFETKGDVRALAIGWRQQLGQSPLLLGVEFAAHDGRVGGRQEWGAYDDLASSEVTFDSKMVYTIGGQLGYVPDKGLLQDYLLYAEGGVAALDGSICGTVSVLTRSESECESGFVFGNYAALGFVKQWGDGFFFGSELQYYAFEVSEKWWSNGHSLGQGRIHITQTGVAVTMGYQF